MTKKELESVYWLNKQLKMWQERLSDLQADIALSPKVLDGMPFAKTNKTGDPTQAKAMKLAEMAKIIEGKIAEIQIAIYEVEELIAKIDDPLLQQIICYRCLNLKQWDEVAELIGAGYTAESVRQIYHRYISTLDSDDV